jgi:hypothetical protein
MATTWKDHIYRKREELAAMLHVPMAALAHTCLGVMDDGEELTARLTAALADIPHFAQLYVLGTDGVQISDSVDAEGVVSPDQGRDLSGRPFMREAMPPWGFLLSDAYVHPITHHPSLTALHLIRAEGTTLGYVGAEFDLRASTMSPPSGSRSKGTRPFAGRSSSSAGSRARWTAIWNRRSPSWRSS